MKLIIVTSQTIDRIYESINDLALERLLFFVVDEFVVQIRECINCIMEWVSFQYERLKFICLDENS